MQTILSEAICLLGVRRKQALRISEQIGIVRLLFLIAFLGVPLFFFLSNPLSEQNGYWISAIFSLVLFTIHQSRSDKRFLKTTFKSPFWIEVIEYSVPGIPVLSLLLINGLPLPGMILILSIFLIPFIPERAKKEYFAQLTNQLINPEHFELRALLRRHKVLMILTFSCGLIFSFQPVVGLIAIYIITFLIGQAHQYGEPVSYIISQEKRTSHFLYNKWLHVVKFWSMFSMPIVIATLIQNPTLWMITLAIVIIMSIYLLFVVMSKYAFFEPNSPLDASNFYISIGALSIILPILLPFLPGLIVISWIKAVKKLKPLLDDFNQ